MLTLAFFPSIAKFSFIAFVPRAHFTIRLPRWFSGEEHTCQAGDAILIAGLGRSPGNLLQFSCLGNPWTEEPGGL